MKHPLAVHLPTITPSDDHGVTQRIRRMGISVTEMEVVDQERVRVWARTLTEVEVEYVAETAPLYTTEDER